MAKFFWDLKHGRSHANKTRQPERFCLLRDALSIQNTLIKRKIGSAEEGLKADRKNNFLLFAEHDHVYVLTQADASRMQVYGDNAKLFRHEMGSPPKDVHVLDEDRGGSIIYHGPGQIVCYMAICEEEAGLGGPLQINAVIQETIKHFLRQAGIESYDFAELCEMENADIHENLLSRGLISISGGEIKAQSSAGGVWVITDEGRAKKIGSRGIKRITKRYSKDHVRHFIKYGFAINLYTDLSYFDYIYPCGEDIEMTSLRQIAGSSPPLYQAAQMLAEEFVKALNKLTKKSHKLI